MTSRPALHELAAYCGILPSFIDWRGNSRDATDEARETLLAAMRIDAATEEGARRALDEIRACDRGAAGVAVLRAAEHVLEGPYGAGSQAGGEHECELVLRDPRGEIGRARTQVRIDRGVARVALPPGLGVSPGYYDAELSIDGSSASASQRWFVLAPPPSCVSVARAAVVSARWASRSISIRSEARRTGGSVICRTWHG